MKKVLLPVYTAGHFTELIRIARLLTASGRYVPTLWIWSGYQGDRRRDRAVCAAEGIRCLEQFHESDTDSTINQPARAKSPRRVLTGLARAVASILPFPVTAMRAIARQRLELARCRALLNREQADLLVLAEDSAAYETAALIRAAHERRIAAAIVPFTICNALEPAEAYFDVPAFGLARWDNRLVARLYPRWRYTHRGRAMLRLPAPQVIAKEMFGLAPPIPWQMNSGSADAIVVESEFMRAYYRREGLPDAQLIVTGAIADDALALALLHREAQRLALCRQLGLPADRRLILCALPPDHFSVVGARGDASDYKTLVRQLMDALLMLPDMNVVVRLHPRTKYEDVAYIEDWGAKISHLDTAELVPLCDLFVASASATIRWALACGRPVVNYDVYHLRWTDFDDAPGVLRVDGHVALAQLLQKLQTDEAFFADLVRNQQADAPRWGKLDGRAGERILNCFDRLVERGPRA